MDGVLLVPQNSKSWIAWIYQTVFFAGPIDMSVVYNDCNGLGLQGELNGDVYNISLEETKARMAGTITNISSLELIDVTGECQILSEDEYEINIRKK